MMNLIKQIIPNPIKKLIKDNFINKPTKKNNEGFLEDFYSKGLEKMNNIDYNRALWDAYSNEWSKEKIFIENEGVEKKDGENYIQYLGDEWGRVSDVEEIVKDYILAFTDKNTKIGEIGTGGGRVVSKVAGSVKEFYCFDISIGMLENAKQALKEFNNINYVLLEGAKLPDSHKESFDFIYSFDVFVHLNLHVIWQYFQEIHKSLKPNGKSFIHTANLAAPDGWKRFVEQETYTVEGHYFLTPEIVKVLAEKAGFKVIKESSISEHNFYFNRDYLIVLEKI
jgi:SAM-dependent methyltransferase